MSWAHVISDLNDAEIAGAFYEKLLQKTNQKQFRVLKRQKNICEMETKFSK